MNKAIFVFLLLVSFTSVSIGQIEFGASANIGISDGDNFSIKEKTKPRFSGLLDLYFHKAINKTIFVGTGLNFSFIRWNENETRDLFFASDFDPITLAPVGTFSNNRTTTKKLINARYIGLPVYLGLKFKKLSIKVGVQVSYKLQEQTKTKRTIELDDEVVSKITEIDLTNNLDDSDYGTKLSLSYHLTKKLQLNGFVYHGLKNINREGDTRKIRHVGIGCNYKIYYTTK